ncbi:UNVERIFIED_CONTAM: hypothetical protein Sindi_3031900 [Sesamum indicum]
MVEFLNLANRVVDTGDATAMEALAKLKTRWEEKFGLVGNLRKPSSLYIGCPTIKPRRCILEPVTGKMRMEGSSATVTFGIPPKEKLQAAETEKSSDSGDILGGFGGKHGCTGAPSSDLALVTGKQAVGTNPIAAVTGLGVPPETQILPKNEQFTVMNRRTPTYADVEPATMTWKMQVYDDVIDDVADDVIHDVDADVMHDVAADVTSDVNMEKIIATTTQVHSFPMGLFVGNIPLNMNPKMGRTLSYIPPTIQNGEVVVRPTMETIRNNSTKWKTTAVGYFLGKRPYFYHVKDFAFSIWPGLREVKATTNGFFFFQFKTTAYMEEAIEGGLWLFQGQPIVLQKWELGILMRKLKHTQVPVWIKLRHLPVELWTKEGLSTVASGIGKPLYPDAITRACTRLDFARVCVMLDVSSTLPKHIIIMTPNEEGGEIPYKIDVEYEWLPHKCTSCMTLGYSAKDCRLNKSSKPVKPPVSVYIPKTGPPRPPPLPPA